MDKLLCWFELHKWEWSPYFTIVGIRKYQDGLCLRCSRATSRYVGLASFEEYCRAMDAPKKAASVAGGQWKEKGDVD